MNTSSKESVSRLARAHPTFLRVVVSDSGSTLFLLSVSGLGLALFRRRSG
jgi:hypothetical protein